MKYYANSTKGFYDEQSINVPQDALEITEQEYTQLLRDQSGDNEIFIGANGKPATRPRPTTPAQRRKNRDGLVRRHLDDVAEAQGFDSMIDAVSYANEAADPDRQAKGVSLRAWRSAVRLAVDAAPDNQPAQALINSLPVYQP